MKDPGWELPMGVECVVMKNIAYRKFLMLVSRNFSSQTNGWRACRRKRKCVRKVVGNRNQQHNALDALNDKLKKPNRLTAVQSALA